MEVTMFWFCLLSGTDAAPLTIDPLDPSGTFNVVNALRPVEPHGGTLKLLLAFNPQKRTEFYEVLSIRYGLGLRPATDHVPYMHPGFMQSGNVNVLMQGQRCVRCMAGVGIHASTLTQPY